MIVKWGQDKQNLTQLVTNQDLGLILLNITQAFLTMLVLRILLSKQYLSLSYLRLIDIVRRNSDSSPLKAKVLY